MADLTITAANVKKTSTTQVRVVSPAAGVTVAPGDVVYLDPNAAEAAKLADANAGQDNARGYIALNAATEGQPLEIATGGRIKLGAGVAAKPYVVSGTAGKIAAAGDLTTGWWTCLLGFSIDGDTFEVFRKPVEVVNA